MTWWWPLGEAKGADLIKAWLFLCNEWLGTSDVDENNFFGFLTSCSFHSFPFSSFLSFLFLSTFSLFFKKTNKNKSRRWKKIDLGQGFWGMRLKIGSFGLDTKVNKMEVLLGLMVENLMNLEEKKLRPCT